MAGGVDCLMHIDKILDFKILEALFSINQKNKTFWMLLFPLGVLLLLLICFYAYIVDFSLLF